MSKSEKKVNYIVEYKKELKKNISNVINEINNKDLILKMENHALKYDRSFDDVKDKILNDEMYAEIFAKDPSKQNIYEKLAANYIKDIPGIVDFKNLSSNCKMFVVDGVITNKRENDVKSIDLTFKYRNKNIYASHKYIKALSGGAQDNQYNDVRNFLRNCNKLSVGDDYFIAICDGDYFNSKIDILNEDFGSRNVISLNIENLETFLNNLPI